MSETYAEFLARKAQLEGEYGFDPGELPSFLFDFQAACVGGRCAKGVRRSSLTAASEETPWSLCGVTAWCDTPTGACCT